MYMIHFTRIDYFNSQNPNTQIHRHTYPPFIGEVTKAREIFTPRQSESRTEWLLAYKKY